MFGLQDCVGRCTVNLLYIADRPRFRSHGGHGLDHGHGQDGQGGADERRGGIEGAVVVVDHAGHVLH